MIPISLTADGHLLADLSGHSVTIPCSLSGLIFLRSLLHQRLLNPDAKIGSEAAPTQEMVRAFLASHKVQVPEGSAAQIEATRVATAKRLEKIKDKFADIYLDLEGIDL